MTEPTKTAIQPVTETKKELVPADTSHQDAKAARVDQVAQLLAPAYAAASTLKLTEAEDKALGERFDDRDVELRSHDGLLYVPHILISDRLNKVIGRGQWSLVRRSEKFDAQAGQLYAECILIIRGCYVGESIGAMQYHANNPKMNYGDALEGAQSEALRRIAAKRLGIGDQVWRPAYCRAWVEKYAEQFTAPDGKTKWRRKSFKPAPSPAPDQPGPDDTGEQPAPPDPTIEPIAPPTEPTDGAMPILPLPAGLKEIWPSTEFTDSTTIEQLTVVSIIDRIKSPKSGKLGPWKIALKREDGTQFTADTFSGSMTALCQRFGAGGEPREVAINTVVSGKWTNRQICGIR